MYIVRCIYIIKCVFDKVKHKGNHSRSSGLILDKADVDHHKTFAWIFSAYTTSILKILSQINNKMNRF